MDINDLRALVTLVSLATFGGICAWALAKRNRALFDEAARVPFMNDNAEETRHE
jgi:cytochrome c oxidase cbb3-type subunit 4